MALPSNAILDGIRGMRGKAKVSYPDASKEVKRIERVTTLPRTDWELDFGTADADYPTCFLVSQAKIKEDAQTVEVYRVYETIPGAALTGQFVTADGQVGTLTRQAVAPGTAVTASALMVSGSVQPESAAKSIKETITVPDVFPETQRSIEIPDLRPTKFRAVVPTRTVSQVSAGTIESAPALAAGELSESQAQITAFKKKVTTTSRDVTTLPQSLSGKKMVTEHGGGIASVTETLSASAALSITPNFRTLALESDPVGDGTYAETKATLDESAWPTLTEQEYNADLDIFIETEKKVVENLGQTSFRVGQVVTEYRDIDKWRTIQIVSKIDSSLIGTTQAFKANIPYSFPNEIIETPVIVKAYFMKIDFGLDTVGTGIQKDAMVTDTALKYRVIEGLSGSFSADVTRTFSVSATAQAAQLWAPQAERMCIDVSLGVSESASESVRGKVLIEQTPSAIHQAWDIPVVNVYTLVGMWHYAWTDATHSTLISGWPKYQPVGTEAPVNNNLYWGMRADIAKTTKNFTAKATIPASLPRGEQIIARVNSERWRFGIWVNDVYRLTVPETTG